MHIFFQPTIDDDFYLSEDESKHAIRVLRLKVDDKIKFIFILKEQDCRKYKFDSSLKLLKPDCSIIKLNNTTKGAICSILMAIDEIDKRLE